MQVQPRLVPRSRQARVLLHFAGTHHVVQPAQSRVVPSRTAASVVLCRRCS